jgi:hypothetical protein
MVPVLTVPRESQWHTELADLVRAGIALAAITWSLRAVAVIGGLGVAVGMHGGGRRLTQKHPADLRPAKEG